MPAVPSSSESSGSSESTERRELSFDEDDSSSPSVEGDSTDDQSNSRKRKFSGQYEKSVGKRQPSFPYHSKYNALYNTIVEEVDYPVDADNFKQWKPGRVGLSYWSSEEKEALFVALDRKGQDDIKGISSFIGSKSESEVRIFILDLQKSVVDDVQDDCSLRIPAAFEISEQCEKELNSAALGLAQRQLAVEEEAEQRRYGDWWLLDKEAAIKLAILPSEQFNLITHQDIATATSLFNITKMIELSSKIYMNSKDLDNNWTTLHGEKSSPGIYGTALIDFYNLVVEIIRRVVASSISLAESRIKLPKRRWWSRSTQPSIEYKDIKSACQLLGLDRNRKAYWIGLARRCNLDVWESWISENTQAPLSYDEVERSLSLGQQPMQAGSGDVAFDNDASIHPKIEHTVTTFRADDSDEDTEEEELERLDVIASRQEETRLWNAIGKSESNPTMVEDEDLTGPSIGGSYRIEKAKGWRQDFDYKPLWQSPTGLPSETLFTSDIGVRDSNSSSTTDTLPVDNRPFSISKAMKEESSESESKSKSNTEEDISEDESNL